MKADKNKLNALAQKCRQLEESLESLADGLTKAEDDFKVSIVANRKCFAGFSVG